MKISASENNEYLILLCFSINWSYRVLNYDILSVKFTEDDDSWSTQLFEFEFSYFASLDFTVSLKRFYFVETNWDFYEIKNVYDLLSIIESRNHKNVENFCFKNLCTKVVVTSQRLNKSLKVKLNAIKTFNETNQHDRKHEPNLRFNEFILGQDMRVKKFTNIFNEIDIDDVIRQLNISFTSSQRETIFEYFTRLFNDLNIV